MTVRGREIQIEGLEELRKTAEKVAPKTASRLARGAVHKVAGIVRNKMRRAAPKDDGTLRKAIVSKRRRGTPTTAVSDVRITHGREAKHDAWYWRFVELGTVKKSDQRFIRPTVDAVEQEIPGMFREEFGKRLEKELNKPVKK